MCVVGVGGGEGGIWDGDGSLLAGAEGKCVLLVIGAKGGGGDL